MKEFVLDNGLRFIYEKGSSMLTSISIALEAGAAVEDGFQGKYGLAHATEHIIFKGTKSRTESEINEILSKLFGFHNAMTNYPYVVYYGTLLEEDFEEGIDILSDILINPSFPVDGFKEEMNSIREELNEWDEELDQFCEDKLFIHSFTSNRLKYPIIGKHEDLNNISLDDIKEFYNKFYTPKNATFAIVSSLDFEEIKNIVEKYFSIWNGGEVKVEESKERPVPIVNKLIREGINTARVEMIFSLIDINDEEIMAFRIFNEFFGEGVNSILFNELRTKRGLVYDVITTISNEKHIRLYKISFNISPDKYNEGINIVNKCYEHIEKYKEALTNEKVKSLVKSIKLKKYFKEEQSVRRTNNIATCNVMYNRIEEYNTMFDKIESLGTDKIINTASKVLKKPSIQIISPR